MKDYKEIFDKMLKEKYFTSKELQYDNEVRIFMTPYDYHEFLSYKDNLIKKGDNLINRLNLKSFNGGYIHFSNCVELLILQSSYLRILSEDSHNTNVPLSIRNMDDITRSRIYSEVEGTLNIESVPTTRKAIEELAIGKRDPKTLNDQIIKNMIEGVDFVNKLPEFNKDNLYVLYNILSKGCLSEENKLHDGDYYRYDSVEVDRYKGCPNDKIEECMDSLFDFVNEALKNKNSNIGYLLPHIVHYYIVYIHPYFDYNGRTARMASYWISLLTNGKLFPQIVSETINQTKSEYYNALSETRDANNDLTYFLIYLFKISIKCCLTYLNIENICFKLQDERITLTNTEKMYLKKILISSKGKFTYGDFIKWINVDMTKQGALKMLNGFVCYNILIAETSKSNQKIFSINDEMIKYVIKGI